jgi:DNA-binding beta-propeller fold protein YncE
MTTIPRALSGFRAAAVMLALSTMAGGAAHADAITVGSFRIEVGQSFAIDVAPTDDGDRAFVLFDGSDPNRVSLIDLPSRSLVTGPEGTFDRHVLPAGGAVVGRKLYLSNWYRAVSVDLDTKVVTSLFEPPFSTLVFVGSPVVASSTRDRVYMVAASSLLAIDTATDAVVETVEVGEGIYGIALSSDDQCVYLVDSFTGRLSRFDAAHLTELGGSSFVSSSGIAHYRSSVTAGPDGMIYVGYVDDEYLFNVSVLDRLGSLKTSKRYDFFSEGLAMTRDGRYLITGTGAFIDSGTLDVVAQARTGAAGYQIHVSADGRYAFVSNYNSTFVTVIDVDSFPLPVTIDVRPAALPGRLDRSRSRLISVVIRSTPDFDATTADPASVCFGSAENPDARNCVAARQTGHLEDVDGDHDADLILHFLAQSTGIAPGDPEACLTGQTYAGAWFAGCDALKVAGTEPRLRSLP